MKIYTLKLTLIFLIFTTFTGYGQILMNGFSFNSNSSTSHDTLFSTIHLTIDSDSLENYILEFDLNEIVSTDTVNVDRVSIELMDYGAADIQEIAFSESSGILSAVVRILPAGTYLLQAKLYLLNGVLVEQTQILTE